VGLALFLAFIAKVLVEHFVWKPPEKALPVPHRW